MTGKLFFLLAIISLCIFTISCTHTDIHASDVVSAMCSAESELPPGTLYSSDTRPGSSGYASDELLSSLYGNGDYPAALTLCRSFAFFLPDTFYGNTDNTGMYEFAVFLCDTAQDARDISLMCSRHSDIMSAHCNLPEDCPLITVYSFPSGRAVIFIISSDTDAALTAAGRALRK